MLHIPPVSVCQALGGPCHANGVRQSEPLALRGARSGGGKPIPSPYCGSWELALGDVEEQGGSEVLSLPLLM